VEGMRKEGMEGHIQKLCLVETRAASRTKFMALEYQHDRTL